MTLHRALNLTLAAVYVAASIVLLLDLFYWRP
jgi:hypothetical protein